MSATLTTRREMLCRAATGFGGLALSALLAEEGRLAASERDDPLAPRPPHHPPRAKRVIFLFMHGGPSHVDLFDPKPLLVRDHGKPLPFAKPRVQFAKTANLLKPHWSFRRRGESGLEITELFPELGALADDLCIIRSMHGSNAAHGGALMKLHTGSDVFIRPSMGSWITYGLGTESRNLPGFVTICPTSLHGGVNNWSSAFLPVEHHGVSLGIPGYPNQPSREARFRHTTNPVASRREQRIQLDLLKRLDTRHSERLAGEEELEARIRSFELAFRMQLEGADIVDLRGESPATLELYGVDDPVTENVGRQCLLARRLAERGVRFVQVTHSQDRAPQEQWDQHSRLKSCLERNTRETDRPIAGLLLDLKARGLLEETLVLWGGEFGRTPTAQNGDGRDHNPDGFTMWMAGAGVRGGMAYGATDDYGYYAVENKVHIHDLHATILHLLGLDHTRLTHEYGGREFRLTDVSGDVKHDILL